MLRFLLLVHVNYFFVAKIDCVCSLDQVVPWMRSAKKVSLHPSIGTNVAIYYYVEFILKLLGNFVNLATCALIVLTKICWARVGQNVKHNKTAVHNLI